MSKTRKSKKVRATSKQRKAKSLVRRKRPVVRLTEAQKAEREARRAERQAEKDYNTEQRYVGLIDNQRTWKLPRFRKLAKLAAKYVRKLNETLNAMRSEYAWLDC